jgi:hypothetical protein
MANRRASGYGPITVLEDNFDDNSIDGAKWNTPGTGVSETGSQLVLNHTATTSIRTLAAPINFDTRVSAEIITLATQGTNHGSHIRCTPDSANTVTTRAYQIDVFNTLVRAVYESTVYGSIAYNSSVHKFLRLSFWNGVVRWQYSTDGKQWITFSTKIIVESSAAMDELRAGLYVFIMNFNSSGAGRSDTWDNFKVEKIVED